MEQERIAVIDMGTNTFHLLIAERNGTKSHILFNEKMSAKIGQGGISKNFISADAYERALKTLIQFEAIISTYQVNRIYATATSAIRNAGNGYALVKEIKEKTGIEVNVISGDKEAELIYEGVKYGMDLGKSTSLIMDIGGGSVEFIICNQDKIFYKESFEIGAQRLLDKFHKNDLFTLEETQQMVDYLEEKLTPLFEAGSIYKPVTLVGSSGTFDTLCDIDVRRKGINFSIEEGIEYTLTMKDFEEISFDILSKTREERMQIPGMAEMRVDMIVVACVLIQFITHKFQTQKIRACAYALKEGVLSKVLKGATIYE